MTDLVFILQHFSTAEVIYCRISSEDVSELYCLILGYLMTLAHLLKLF